MSVRLDTPSRRGLRIHRERNAAQLAVTIIVAVVFLAGVVVFVLSAAAGMR